MKVYKSDYNDIKWYKKINWIKLIISILLLVIVLTIFFNLIGKGKDFERAVRTSILISGLIGIGIVIDDLFGDKTIIFLEDKNKLKYINLHNGTDGKYISDLEYWEMIDNNKPEDIYNNLEKFEGIDSGQIKEVLKIRKTSNCLIVKALVKEKRWKAYGHFRISKMTIKEKEYKKKIIIKNDFQDYDKIYEILLKKCR